MKNINVAVLGDNEFAAALGKKGTSTDFTFYNHKSEELTATFMAPTSYPDKLQSLTHVLALADTAIVVIKGLNKELGEFILALDLLGIKGGLVIFDEYVEKEKFLNLVNGTTIETFVIIDKKPAEVYLRLAKMELPRSESEYVIVDSAFDVKGVGTVVLGVSRGNFAVHDELQIFASGKMTGIRSIQVHDRDVKSAGPGERVGLALKGITIDDIERGNLLAKPGVLQAGDILAARWKQSKYFEDKIEAGMKLFVAAGLQYRPVTVEKIDGESIVLKIDKKIAYSKGSKFLILKPEGRMRIAGVIEVDA